MRSAIEAAVPVGFGQHDYDKVRGSAHARAARQFADRLDRIVEKHPGVAKMQRQFARTWISQLGTLGGGNHFIELCLDEAAAVWVMLHSGSRGIGNVLGRYFIAAARKDMERHQLRLPDRDLAYFSEGSTLFDDYVEAVEWAQDYAAGQPPADDGAASSRRSRRTCRRSRRRARRSTATTTTWRRKSTSGSACSSPARARSARATASSASSPAAWAPSRTSCAAWATRSRSTPARTAPAGA